MVKHHRRIREYNTAIANFRKDAGSVIYAVGNKGYDRKVFNYNKVISDQLAIRFMALDHFQGYEHNYKKYDLESQTLSLNLRLIQKIRSYYTLKM